MCSASAAFVASGFSRSTARTLRVANKVSRTAARPSGGVHTLTTWGRVRSRTAPRSSPLISIPQRRANPSARARSTSQHPTRAAPRSRYAAAWVMTRPPRSLKSPAIRPQPTMTTRVSGGMEGQLLLDRHRAGRMRIVDRNGSGIALREVFVVVHEPDDVEGVEGGAARVQRLVDCRDDLEIDGIVDAKQVLTIERRRGEEVEQAIALGVAIEVRRHVAAIERIVGEPGYLRERGARVDLYVEADREREPIEHVRDVVDAALQIASDGRVDDGGIDQRAVARDLHDHVGLQRRRRIERALQHVVDRAAIARHALRARQRLEGVIRGLACGRDPDLVDHPTPLEPLEQTGQHGLAEDG